MSDFSQLKSYLDQTSPSSSSATPIESVKTSVLDFFNKNWSNSDTSKPSASNQTAGAAASQATSGDDGQTDSWFKEADTDPYCPKLVNTAHFHFFTTFKSGFNDRSIKPSYIFSILNYMHILNEN